MKNLGNIKYLICFFSIIGSIVVFVISVVVSFIMTDRPIHITCSNSDKVCRSYTTKLGTMFYHGVNAAKYEHTNPKKSKKHADVIKKDFDEPSKIFLVSDIQGYKCSVVPFDAMSKYKSYIVLKNGKKVILGQHQNMDKCEYACQKVEKDIKNWDYSKNITLITE